MNPENLLGKTFACECGKTHSVAIRETIYSESAVNEAPGILNRNFQGKTTVIIADQRTYAAAGKMLNDSLAKQGWQVDNLIVPDGKGDKDPVCDDNTLDYIRGHLPECNFYLAVGEHMISHALDSTALERGLTHDYHGRQVGLGTIFACALYERILAMEKPRFQLQTEETNKAFWQSLVPVVDEEHARKQSKAANAVEQLKNKNCWDELRAIAGKSVRTPSEIRHCLKSAGAAYKLADIECDRARFLEAALNCHQMRERYTVIDLARAVGIMPKAADEIIEQYLM